ncbi:MAG: PAS domain S-box protein, partial [Chitinivibrionales bacterium]
MRKSKNDLENLNIQNQPDETLQLSLQRLALHVEQTPLAVIEFDIEGRIRAWNPAAENIFGYSSQEAFGKNWSFIVPAEIHDQIDKVWAAIVQQRGGKRSTNENITKEGRKIYCEWFNTPLVNLEGRTIGVTSLIQDVTQRKETENTLRKNQEKFHNLFNNAEVGMFRSKLDGSEILEMNDRFLEIFGRSRQEMQNNPSLAHCAVPSEREEMVRKLSAEGNVREFECKMLTKQGEVKFCLTSLRLYKEQGILEGSILDISERKRAEEELSKSQMRLELAAKSAHLGVWDWDIVNNKMVWDAQMFRLYGIFEKPSDYGIEIWQNGLHPDDIAYAWEACQAALRGEKKYDIEFRVKHPDGAIRFLKADGIVLRDGDGRAVRMIGINRDVTDLKQSQKALRESEEIFKRFMDNSPIYVFFKDEKIRAVRLSKNFENMLGKPVEEMLGKSMDEIFP